MPGEKAYGVGYGKPPTSGQFKPGVSGNPKGRPKKPPSLERLLEAELAKVVTVNIDGTPKKLSQGQLVIKALLRKAVNGDVAAARVLLAGWQGLATEANATPPPITKDDLSLLKTLIEEAGGGLETSEAGLVA